MIFTLSTIAVVTAFVVCEVVLRPRYEKMLVSREHMIRTVHERLGRIRKALRTLSSKDLQRFDPELDAFLDAYDAIGHVYTQTAANFRTPPTAIGLWLSNRKVGFFLQSLRRVEIRILARTRLIDRRILTWAEYLLQLQLGEIESTRRWVRLFLPKQEQEAWYDKLMTASDALTSAHERLRYDAERVARPALMVRMREAFANARTAISDVQQRVQDVTAEALQELPEQRLS